MHISIYLKCKQYAWYPQLIRQTVEVGGDRAGRPAPGGSPAAAPGRLGQAVAAVFGIAVSTAVLRAGHLGPILFAATGGAGDFFLGWWKLIWKYVKMREIGLKQTWEILGDFGDILFWVRWVWVSGNCKLNWGRGLLCLLSEEKPCPYKVGEVVQMSPQDIGFSHFSISAHFRNKTSLASTLRQLINREIRKEDIETVQAPVKIPD